MQITDILTPEAIRIIECQNYCKEDVLTTLSCKLAECCSIPSEPIFKQLLERERSGSTALGKGVALPHIRIKNLSRPIAAFINVKNGVEFESPDHEPVNYIFGLLVPENADNTHLNILANVANIFCKEEVRSLLSQSQTEQTIYNIFAKECLGSMNE